MAPLLQPTECSLVLVDPKTKHLGHADSKAQYLQRRFQHLHAAAHTAAVPVHLISVGTAPHPDELITTPELPAAGVYIVGDAGPCWSKSGLAETLAGQQRTSLILCGFWLETTVTFLALPALACGFDVFVLMDISLVRLDEARRPAAQRLLQAGAVPVTTHQLIAEWAEQVPDAHVRSSLSSLIATD